MAKTAAPPAAARGNVAAYEGALGGSFPKPAVEVLVRGFDAIEHGAFAAH